MPPVLRRLAPVLIAEFVLAFVTAIFAKALTNSIPTVVHLVISLSVLPFLAGYIVARESQVVLLRRCSAAGASVSLASLAAVTVVFAIQSAEVKLYLLAMAGYVVSIIISAVPQSMFALLGGWAWRRCRATSGP